MALAGSLELPLTVYILHLVGDLCVKFRLKINTFFPLKFFADSIFHTKYMSRLQFREEIPTLVSYNLAAAQSNS